MKTISDFDKLTIRKGTGCYKWDEMPYDDLIPLWVADMDFEVALPIREALQKRLDHGVFGYAMPQDSYYDSIIRWYQHRHDWTIDREWIVYTTGVVPAVSAVIRAMTLPSEQVIMLTPAYNCFYSCIRNNGCEIVESPLVYDEQQGWGIDYADLERKCQNERARIFLFCNPHNPVGRVWTREEMLRINDICRRNGVMVLADEIHNEVVMPGYKYIPFANVSDDCLHNSITCCSPTKGFNIAGLKIANIICPDAAVRYRVDRAVNIMECCDVGPFGIVALEAAYNEGEQWLDEMCEYIHGNYELLKHMLPYPVSKLEGTYLAWVDIRSTGRKSDAFTYRLLVDKHVQVSSGTLYGKDGEGYIRINLACPRERLKEGLERMLANC